jgi:hypothetical protein
MILNEEEKLKLMEEIDMNAIELVQKRLQVADMTKGVEAKKTKYKGLKIEIKQLDDKVHYLVFSLKEKEDDLDQLNHIIAQKDIEIEQLTREAGINPPEFHDPARAQAKVTSKQRFYRPIMGDLVDESLGALINEAECRLPIKRLDEGWYLFGTIKIYIKMIGGRLMAKSGGAYIGFEEFMQVKADSEQAKIEELIAKREWD